jgi:hypothetical protein
MELLEYLGSWDGNEAGWPQFLSATEEAPADGDESGAADQTAADTDNPEAQNDRPDVVSAGMP